MTVSKGLRHAAADRPSLEGGSASFGEEFAALDREGFLQVDQGQVGLFTHAEVAADPEDAARRGAHRLDEPAEGDAARLHQFRVKHREGGLQTDDAVQAVREAAGLLFRGMGRVVGGNHIDGSIAEPFNQGLAVV